MSTKAKVTFAASLVFSTLTVFGVHYLQTEERKLMRKGPIRDDERQRQKLLNKKELEMQQQLYEEMKKDQNIKPTVDPSLHQPN